MSIPSTAVQAPPAGRYATDPAGSSVTFATRHMFGLAKVRGRLEVTRGVITVTDPPEDSRVEAEVSASSFSTGNFMRDPQVRSRLFLDVRRHRAISFRSGSIRQHRGGWSVAGVLTVKERTAPVELTVTDVSADGTAIVFHAACTVDRYAHGITMMPGMAARRLSIEITARATRA
jgi:polyisoprenoid-binding protein YceI